MKAKEDKDSLFLYHQSHKGLLRVLQNNNWKEIKKIA